MMKVRRPVRPITVFGFSVSIGQVPAVVIFATEGKIDLFGYGIVALGLAMLFYGLARTDLLRLSSEERELRRSLDQIIGRWRADEVLVAKRLMLNFTDDVIVEGGPPDRLQCAIATMRAADAIVQAAADGKDWALDWRKFLLFDLEVAFSYGREIRDHCAQMGRDELREWMDERLAILRLIIEEIKSGRTPPPPTKGKRRRRRTMRDLGTFDFGGLGGLMPTPAGAAA